MLADPLQPPPAHTLAHIVSDGRRVLQNAGLSIDEAGLDARLIAQHILGWDAARFFTCEQSRVPREVQDHYSCLIARRAAREPLAYITGTKEFWAFTFEVTPAVLIPRPETELLVESALSRLPLDDNRARVADVCTGSGCVAVALALERPAIQVVATDVSYEALRVARRNAERLGAQQQIVFVRADLLKGIRDSLDLVVANPPYVPETDLPTLQPEVRNYEPAVALLAGADGLSMIRRLVPQALGVLKPRGTLLFEFGAGQQRAIESLLAVDTRVKNVEFKCDLAGIPRVALATCS